MKQNKTILLFPILLLSLFFVNALTYNFPVNNNFLNIQTNNSGLGIGNYNNSYYLVSSINGSVHKIDSVTLADSGVLTGVGTCNTSITGIQTYKLPLNETACATPSSVLTYTKNGNIEYSTGGYNKIYVTKYNSTQYYYYYLNGISIRRALSTTSSTVGFDCFNTLNTSLNNNFGVSLNSFDNIIQDNLERWIFNIGNRWFYINDSALTNLTSCSNMIVEEATINIINETSNDKDIIINSKLLINTKVNNLTELYSSGNVDIHSGLVYYNGVWYKQNNTCFKSVLGYGFFNETNGELQCTDFLSGGYCNSNLNICSAGCTYDNKVNIYGVNYKEGVCALSNCSNTCGVLGQVKSDTLSSYQICALNYTTDGCSHWSPSIECLPNQISTNGVCNYVNTSINYITKLSYSVNPYTAIYIPNTIPPVLNNNLWNVTFEPLTSTVTAITNQGLGGSGAFPLYVQVPYQYPSYFLGIDCNYKSTKNVIPLIQNQIRNNVPVELINGTRNFILNGQNRGYQKITLIDDSNINVTEFSLSVEDVNTKIIQTTYFIVNKTNGEIIAYQDNKTGSLLYTETFTAGITIGKIEVELYEDFNNLQANNMLSLYRFIDNNNQPLLFSRGVGVLSYKDNLATTPYKIVLTNYSSNISVSNMNNEIIMSTLTQLSSLVSGTSIDYVNGYDSTSCVYLNDGTYNARFYLSERAGNQYFSTKDITIIKRDVNTADSIAGQGNKGFNFSVMTKIFIAIGSSILIGLIFLVLGFVNDNDTARKIFIFIGLFSIVLGLIAFSIAGWIPAWILILGVILAGLGVGIFFVSKSNGSD